MSISSDFARYVRKYAVPGFIFCTTLVLLLTMVMEVEERVIRTFSALLTPVVAIFGGLLAAASFQLNYDKRIQERRQPIDELIEEFAQYCRDLQTADPPQYEEIKAFSRRVSIYLDAELGDRIFDYFTNFDMAGEDLAKLNHDFVSIASKRFEALK